MSIYEDVGEDVKGKRKQMGVSEVLEELGDELVWNGTEREKARDHLKPMTRVLLLPAPAELNLRPTVQTHAFVQISGVRRLYGQCKSRA